MSCYILINYLKGENKMANFKLNSVVNSMIDAGVLSADLIKVTVETLRSDDKNEKQWFKLADTYHAKGITAAMLATKKSGGIEKLREAVRGACALSLTDDEQMLYNKESKLIESGSAEAIARTGLINKVSSKLSKVESHLNKIEKKAAGVKPTPPAPAMQRALKMIDKALEIITGDDDGSLHGDIVGATKDLRAAKTKLG